MFKYIWFSKIFLLLCLILQTSKNMMSLGLKSQCIEVIVTLFPKNHFIFQQAVLCLEDYLHSSKVNLLVEGKWILSVKCVKASWVKSSDCFMMKWDICQLFKNKTVVLLIFGKIDHKIGTSHFMFELCHWKQLPLAICSKVVVKMDEFLPSGLLTWLYNKCA